MGGTEVVDLVDDEDRVVGDATVAECLEKGLLHRAVAVLVVRSDGRLLIQQRSRKDLWHPGLWTLTSTGHVKRGETYEAAAGRELREEVGIEAQLSPKGKVLMPPITSGNLTEREWVSSYVAKSDAPPLIDKTELEAAADFSADQLKRMMGSGVVTPDAVIVLRRFFLRP